MDLLLPLESGDDEFLAIGALVLVFVMGLGLMYVGFQKYRVGRLIKNTPPERIQSIALGRTEVHGAVRDAGMTLSAPFTSDECVYREWKIEEQRVYRRRDSDGRTKTKRRWVTLDEGSEAVPFYVEDETGQVFVNADDGTSFTISSDNSLSESLGRRSAFPSTVTSFMNRRSDVVDPMAVLEASPLADHFDGHRAESLTPREFDQLTESEQELITGAVPEEYLNDEENRLTEPIDAQKLGVHLEPQFGDALEDTGGILASIDPGGSPPRRLVGAARNLISHLDDFASQGTSRRTRNVRRRRYSQAILPINEEVYVFGGATQRPGATGGNADRLVIETDESTGRFIVSDKDEHGLVRYYNRRSPLYILGGLALSALMLYLLLTMFGGF